MNRTHFKFFLSTVLMLFCGFSLIFIHRNPTISNVNYADFKYLPWIASALIMAIIIEIVVVRIKSRRCAWMFSCACFLSCLGILAIARLDYALTIPQIRWFIVGMAAFIVAVRSEKILRQMLNYEYILGISCIILLIIPLIFGVDIGGNKNWLILGNFRIQPSEFAKILLVFFLAAYLSEHRKTLDLREKRLLFFKLPPIRFLAPLIAIWGASLLMFVVARDLGAALIFFAVAVVMTYAATGNKSYFIFALVFFVTGAIISYYAFNHVQIRFNIWLNPWSDPRGAAYQIVESLFAIENGNVWGAGFTKGYPTFIPEVHTDFIFSAIAEELGLVGSISLILIYSLFFYQSVVISLASVKEEEMLLIFGAGIMFFLQTFIIMGGVTKFFPLTGVTLPFMSYGGSSMVSCFILLGVIVALSRKENVNV
ncbi:MAG: FtsW/RodA/SpoVE family cell cycle protein [Selenomonadaceae bacterium]|nr:FtsW/RodA/SpoVE family cell cycle protein [Selenomonadaceae bacterium]